MALAGGSLHSTCVVRCCGAYFSLDAAAFSRCSRPVSPVCCISPLFLKFVHFILKNTLDFQANLLQIWARIRQIYGRNLGPFQSKLWPGPSHGVVAHGGSCASPMMSVYLRTSAGSTQG